MKKTVFIIPGFKHHPITKAYKEIAKILKKEGYLPIFVPLVWKKRTVSENTAYFLKAYKKINRKKKYILGFSFGAMVAFIASTKVKSSGLILCSLSPFFQEDIKNTKMGLMSSLMAERYEDFAQFRSSTLAKKIKTKQIHMLYGSKEERSLKKRVNETFGHISSTRKCLIQIQKTEHTIGSMRYLQTIQQIARSLY